MKPEGCYVCSDVITSKRSVGMTIYCLKHMAYLERVNSIIRSILISVNNPISAAEEFGFVRRLFAGRYEEIRL